MTKKRSAQEFIRLEFERISFDKWIEGCRLHADPGGNKYVEAWIRNNAARYRSEWNDSICRYCRYCMNRDEDYHYTLDKDSYHFCGLNLVQKCDRFAEIEEGENDETTDQ